MCEFASFVLTKDQAFWLTDSESHEGIIKHYNLQHLDKDPIGVVRVEIFPPKTSADNLNSWEFQVDQDVYPDWTYRGDPSLESRTREALYKRSVEEKWFEIATGQHVMAGNFGTATAGDHGMAAAGDCGKATAGDCGIAFTGNFGNASAGDYGTASAGAYGTASVGDFGTASAGYNGKASAGINGNASVGNFGNASAGYGGKATAGVGGTASAGKGGTIIARWSDPAKKSRILVGYIGENGLEPDTKYRVANGSWVKVD